MAEKIKGFRFGMRTVNNINAVIEELGLARNQTEAIDLALEHFVTEERTRRDMKRSNAQTRT